MTKAIGDDTMEYKSISLAGVFSAILGAACAVGIIALNVLPSGRSAGGPAAGALLSIGFLVFMMLSTIARDVAAILATHADQIAELRRQLADRQSAS
jgi:hypothetical protein